MMREATRHVLKRCNEHSRMNNDEEMKGIEIDNSEDYLYSPMNIREVTFRFFFVCLLNVCYYVVV
jgi:hypothetical protein